MDVSGLAVSEVLAQLGESQFVDFTSHPRVRAKLVNESRVGQVRPVDSSCGQVGDLDPSLVNSRNLSWVGQVKPVNSFGQVRNIDPCGSK